MQYLREERHTTTRRESIDALSSVLENATAEKIDTGFVGVNSNGFRADEALPFLNSLSSLDILGERRQVFEGIKRDEDVYLLRRGDEEVTFSKYQDGYSYLKGNTPLLVDEVKRGRVNIDIYKAISELSKQSTNLSDQGVSETAFSISDNPLQFLEVMSALGIEVAELEDYKQLAQLPGIGDISAYLLEVMIPNAFRDGKIVVSPVDHHTMVLSLPKENYQIELIPAENGKLRLGYKIDFDKAYMEKPNQAPGLFALPFVETQTAEDLLSNLQTAGIRFNPTFETEMVSGGESDRYGNVFTHLTRDIAAFINFPLTFDLSRIFVSSGDLEAKIMTIERETVEDRYAQSVITMLQDLVDRKNKTDHKIDVNSRDDMRTTKSHVGMRDGSCFDTVSYYEKAIRHGAVYEDEHNGKRFLFKRFGSHTGLSQDEILFNGIKIPPGALFKQGEDGGYALLRLTPYVDPVEAKKGPFASEVVKTLRQNKQTQLSDPLKYRGKIGSRLER